MDKLTRRVTGVFNSIKEALPTFEESSVDSWKTDESDIAAGGEDKSSTQVQKSFLFSDFLVTAAASSSAVASPLASPMTETPRSVVNYDQFSCRHVPVTQASSKVGLAKITCWRINEPLMMMSMCFQKSEFESSLDFLVHSIDRQYFTPRMKGLGVGSFDWKESHSVTDCRMIPTSECQIYEVTFKLCFVQRIGDLLP